MYYKLKKCIVCLMAAMAFVSCGNVNDFPDLASVVQSSDTDKNQEQNDSTSAEEVPVVLEDDIVIDETPLANEVEKTLTATDGGMFKDFLYNYTFDDDPAVMDYDADYPPTTFFDEEKQEWKKGVKTLAITFADDNVTYTYTKKNGKAGTIDAADFEITRNGAHITIKAHTKCNYVLQGTTTNGSLKLYSDKKFIVTMKGVSITNPTGAAINIQKGTEDDGNGNTVLASKRAFIVVYEGTKNYLTDGSSYNTATGEDEKGVLFSEGKLCFSGSGYLFINSNGKHGIASDDYIYLHKGPQITINASANNDGIKAKDGIYMAGGVLNITCSGNAAKGINTDNVMVVSGGRATVINTAVPYTDAATGSTSKPYCVKVDQSLTMSGGALILSASKDGGNGISVGDVLTFSKGTIKMVVKETPLTYKSLNKTDGTLYINGEEK